LLQCKEETRLRWQLLAGKALDGWVFLVYGGFLALGFLVFIGKFGMRRRNRVNAG
jgi:hypothetical protein